MREIEIKKNLKKKITFYCENHNEIQSIDPLLTIFKQNNFETKITDNLTEYSEIGYYCIPSNSVKKINTNFSIVSLGGIDQGKLFWPNFWYKEPWDKFDLGILPGENWLKMWKTSSWYSAANPKFGVVVGGWPKTQNIKKESLNTKNKNKLNILYAPCFENDNKGLDVINAIKDLNVTLMVKYLDWSTKVEKVRYKDIRNNNNKIIRFLRNNFKGDYKIFNSKNNIFDIFSKTDLLITDESSVIFEALLFDVPSLSCKDWLLRTSNSLKARYVEQKNSEICNYTTKINLRSKIEDIILNYDKYRKIILEKKKEHFSHIDNSANNIFNIINNLIENNQLKNVEKPDYNINYVKSYLLNIKKKFRKF